MSIELTSHAIGPVSDAIANTWPPLYRFSVEEYHRMPAAGILLGEKRVELLDGWIVEKSPIGPLHSHSVEILRRMIERLLPANWHVRTQHPVTLATSEPQPDLAVVRGNPGDYRLRHPAAHEIGLLIEVADSSFHHDRERKLPLYAAAGVPEYWIVDLAQRRVEVHRDVRPSFDASPAIYATPKVFQPQDALPLVLAGREVGRLDLAELMG